MMGIAFVIFKCVNIDCKYAVKLYVYWVAIVSLSRTESTLRLAFVDFHMNGTAFTAHVETSAGGSTYRELSICGSISWGTSAR